MRGSIRQRSKGSWEICIDVGRDPATGKRLRHFQSVKGNKKHTQQRLAELLVSIEQGDYFKPRCLILGEWLENWVESYVTTNCSPRTVDSYRSEVRGHIVPALGAIPLTQLRPQHLQTYYAHALSQGRVDGKGGLSARTVLYHHRILFEALSHVVKMGLLIHNVAEAVDPPRPEHKSMRTLAAQDAPKLLEAARQNPHYVLFCTALFTGMRLGELLGLRWRDLDLDRASLSVVQALYKRRARGICRMIEPKSPHSRRSIALSPVLVSLLRPHKAKQEAERILLREPAKRHRLGIFTSRWQPSGPWCSHPYLHQSHCKSRFTSSALPRPQAYPRNLNVEGRCAPQDSAGTIRARKHCRNVGHLFSRSNRTAGDGSTALRRNVGWRGTQTTSQPRHAKIRCRQNVGRRGQAR